jgi:hypothetical protein
LFVLLLIPFYLFFFYFFLSFFYFFIFLLLFFFFILYIYDTCAEPDTRAEPGRQAHDLVDVAGHREGDGSGRARDHVAEVAYGDRTELRTAHAQTPQP